MRLMFHIDPDELDDETWSKRAAEINWAIEFEESKWSRIFAKAYGVK